jgi:hypothetical protein
MPQGDDVEQQTQDQIANVKDPQATMPSANSDTGTVLSRQECPTCGSAGANSTGGETPGFVHALGRIEARFPPLSV